MATVKAQISWRSWISYKVVQFLLNYDPSKYKTDAAVILKLKKVLNKNLDQIRPPVERKARQRIVNGMVASCDTEMRSIHPAGFVSFRETVTHEDQSSLLKYIQYMLSNLDNLFDVIEIGSTGTESELYGVSDSDSVFKGKGESEYSIDPVESAGGHI